MEKVLSIMLSRMDEMRSALRMEDETVAKLARDYLRYLVGEGPPLSNEDYLAVAKFLPVEVDYGDKFVFLLDPTDNELKKVMSVVSGNLVNAFLTQVIARNAEIKVEERRITLAGDSYVLDPASFGMLITQLYGLKSRVAEDYKEHMLRSAVERLKETYKIVDVEKTGTQARVAVEFENGEVVEFTISPWLLSSYVVEAGKSDGDYRIVAKYRFEASKDIVEAVNIVKGKFDTLAKELRELYNIAGRVSGEYGFAVRSAVAESNELYENVFVEMVKPGTVVRVYNDRVTTLIEVFVKDPAVIKVAKNTFLSLGAVVGSVSRKDESVVMELVWALDANKYEEHLREVLGMVDETRRYVEDLYRMKASTRKTMRELTTEIAVFGVIVAESFGSSDAQIITGYRLGAMRRKALGYLKKVDPEAYKDLTRKDQTLSVDRKLIYHLVKTGFIRSENDGDVYIGNVSIDTLLSLLPSVSGDEELKTRLRSEVLNTILLILYTHDKQLFRKFVARPKLLTKVGFDFMWHESLLLHEYRGRPVWESLSYEEKLEIIKRLPLPVLEKFAEKYGEVSEEGYRELMELLKEKSNTFYLNLLVKTRPEVLGVEKGSVEIVSLGLRFGVKYGEHIVLPLRVDEATPNSEKLFLVFTPDEKVGIPVRSTTLSEAVEKSREAYHGLLQEVAKFKSDPNWTVELVRLGTYQVYSAVSKHDYTKILVVVPGLYSKLAKHGKVRVDEANLL